VYLCVKKKPSDYSAVKKIPYDSYLLENDIDSFKESKEALLNKDFSDRICRQFPIVKGH
jgi:hypothetical protein